MARSDLTYRQMRDLIAALKETPVEGGPLISGAAGSVAGTTEASVAGTVMARLAARQRRLSAIRWASVVATASLVAVAINAYGLAAFEYLYRLAFHSQIPQGVGALGKVAQVLRAVADAMTVKLAHGALAHDAGIYAAQIWTAVVATAIVVIVMMYFMGLWLGKPKGRKSWLARRSLHNGFQVL